MDDRNVDTIFSIDGDIIDDDDDEDHDGDGDAKNDVDAAGKRNQKKRKLIQKQVDKVMDHWIRVMDMLANLSLTLTKLNFQSAY